MTKDLVNNLKVLETLFVSLLFVLFGCNDTQMDEKPDYLYERCKKCDDSKKHVRSIQESDSIHFILPDEFGRIDVNIPPKFENGKFYIKTKSNYLMVYGKMNSQGDYTPEKAISLPDIHTRIADFKPLSDNRFYLTSHTDTNYVYLFDSRSGSLKKCLGDSSTRWNAMPFIGLTFQMYKNRWILPFIPMEEYNKGRFLSVYSDQLKYERSVGFGRDHKAKKFAPLFDSPIVTRIEEDGTFYASYSSGEQVVKCQMYNDFTISYIDSICFPKTFHHENVLTISQKGLADFETMRRAHSCDIYTIRLMNTENFVYRIIKLEQDEIDPETRRIRTVIDAPWKLERYSKSNKSFQSKVFKERTFIHSSSFQYSNQHYFLTHQSLDQNVLTFIAF